MSEKKTKKLYLDISASCSPAVCITFPGDDDISELGAKITAESIQNDIETSLNRFGGTVKYSLNNKIKVSVNPRTDLVAKTDTERKEEMMKRFNNMPKFNFPTAEEMAEQNPDKNKSGWWEICGIRHGGAVKADNATDALKKAKEKNIVNSDWDIFALNYLGENPDSFVY